MLITALIIILLFVIAYPFKQLWSTVNPINISCGVVWKIILVCGNLISLNKTCIFGCEILPFPLFIYLFFWVNLFLFLSVLGDYSWHLFIYLTSLGNVYKKFTKVKHVFVVLCLLKFLIEWLKREKILFDESVGNVSQHFTKVGHGFVIVKVVEWL